MREVNLANQIDFVFKQLEQELTGAIAGTILIHVRNNAIGKFGIKHHPIEINNDQLSPKEIGLSKEQVQSFKKLAIDALKFKKNWTHGEILYDFSVRPNKNTWTASVLYESNYNMSTWNMNPGISPYSKRNPLIDYGGAS